MSKPANPTSTVFNSQAVSARPEDGKERVLVQRTGATIFDDPVATGSPILKVAAKKNISADNSPALAHKKPQPSSDNDYAYKNGGLLIQSLNKESK